jgi:uncharacterized RDD family membrane protein YckC
MSDTTPAEGMWGPQPGTPAYGGLLKRFGARLLDGLLVGITIAVVFAILPGLSLGGLVYNVVAAGLSFGYFVFMESSRGQTLGKQVLGLRVTGEGGQSPVAPEVSARRNAWMLLGVLGGVPVLGVLAGLLSLGIVIAIAVTIGSDPQKRGLHDKFGGTMVLEDAA